MRASSAAAAKAGLQALYNPDRIAGPMARNASGGFDSIKWDDAIARLSAKIGAAQGKVGAINGYGNSTFSTLLNDWMKALGGTTTSFEPFGREAERAANEKTWGKAELAQYNFAAAKHIVSFGADFLETWGPVVEQQRGFAAAHGFHEGTMSPLVFVGPRMSLTGANADTWLNVPAGTEAACGARDGAGCGDEEGQCARRLARDVQAGTRGQGHRAHRGRDHGARRSIRGGLALAGDFGRHSGAASRRYRSVRGGQHPQRCGRQPPAGRSHLGTGIATSDGYGSMLALFDKMGKGEIQVVLVHDANPLYACPKSGKFADNFKKVPFKVSTAQVMDETAAACDLILPNLHALERWDDLTPRAGVMGLMQPVVEPIFPGMHFGDVLFKVSKSVGGALAQFNAASFEEHLKSAWQKVATQKKAGDFDDFWRASLAKGGIFEPVAEADQFRTAAKTDSIAYNKPTFDGTGDYVFLPYPSMQYHDGRGANKPWLLENPDPITKITPAVVGRGAPGHGREAGRARG